MQTLQSLARAVALLTDSVQSGGGAAQAAGPAAAGPQGPPALVLILGAIVSISAIVTALPDIGVSVVDSAQAPVAPAASREQRRLQVEQRVFVGELVSAVVDSGIIEHLARAVLVAVAAPAPAPAPQLVAFVLDMDQALESHLCAAILTGFTTASAGVWRLLAKVKAAPACGGTAAAAKLCAALCGPCAQHATLTAGLAALCLADGGPSHGLPGELLQAMPVLPCSNQGAPKDVRHLHDRQGVSIQILQQLVRCVAGPGQPQPRPPSLPGPAATASILLRIGRWALASARAWAERVPEPGPAASNEAVRPPLRPLVPIQGLVNMVYSTVSGVDTACRSEPAPAAASGWRGRACVERWQLVVDACECVLRYANAEEDIPALAAMWIPAVTAGRDGRDGMLPPAPPAPLQAALAAGLLPCLERLLRRAGQAPEGREADFALELLEPICADILLARLFAYGDPTQAAALAAMLAKLLWRPEQSLGAQRLQRLLLLSVARTLPLQWTRLQARPAKERQAALGPVALLWVRILLWDRPAAAAKGAAAACGHGGGSSCSGDGGGGSGSSDGGGGSGSGDGDGGSGSGDGSSSAGISGGDGNGVWTRSLVEQVGVLPLLGSLLRCKELWDPAVETARDAHSSANCAYRLVHACALVALAAPEDVWRATEEGAAAEAATGSERAAGAPVLSRAEGDEDGGGAGSQGCQLPTSYWRPEAVLALGRKLAEAGRAEGERLTLRLAALLSRWAQGSGGGCGRELAELRGTVGEDEEDAWERRWRPLPPLAEVRSLLPACAHPGCVSLDGDSEAGRRLRRYALCGEGAYCSAGCAREHGRAMRAEGRRGSDI